MTAPSYPTRSTPAGIPLKDGYQCLVSLQNDADIQFWEKTVQPPGIDGGDAIDGTTMHNETYRTFFARSLKTLTEMTLTVAYDPVLYTSILAQINVNQTIGVSFSDGSTLAFYGYVRLFEPQEVSEGSQPEANVTIQPTNWDPVANTEEAPVLVEVAGT